MRAVCWPPHHLQHSQHCIIWGEQQGQHCSIQRCMPVSLTMPPLPLLPAPASLNNLAPRTEIPALLSSSTRPTSPITYACKEVRQPAFTGGIPDIIMLLDHCQHGAKKKMGSSLAIYNRVWALCGGTAHQLEWSSKSLALGVPWHTYLVFALLLP